jgi:hypothetical protein
MTGKYTNPLKYHAVRLQRFLLRRYLARLSRWEPMMDPQEGYSLCIGGSAPLAAILAANLELLSRQDLAHCRRIFIVFDHPRDQLPLPIEEQMRQRHPGLPLEFLYYTPAETRVFRRIGFPGCYSWFSWHKAIARCRTRYAILHDFDALLLKPTLLEERYCFIREQQAHWCGIRWYTGNGVLADDSLATTFEMILDAFFVRQRFHPIDAFNHVTIHNGRTVDFDTFLDCQARAGKSVVLPIAEQEMVHPSQVVHQFTELTHRRHYIPPEHNNLLMIPYFLHLAGQGDLLAQTRRGLETMLDQTLPFFGRPMNLSRLSATHARWLRKQADLLERTLIGETRHEVRAYFDAIDAAAIAGTQRTPGMLPSQSASLAHQHP